MPRKTVTKAATAGTRKTPQRAAKAATAWSVASAKAHLSAVLEKARTEGPQTITRNGKNAAVVVGFEEWEKKSKRKESLAEFLYNSPLRGSGIDLERVRDKPRDIKL